MRMMRLAQMLLLAVTAAALSARPAVGQEIFKTSRTEVDLSTYDNVFDCLAAVNRVLSELQTKEFHATQVWRDTLPLDPDELWEPMPAAVGETARKCLESAGEHAASAPIAAWRHAANLYLHAGMVDSARAVVERRLNAVEPDSADQLIPLFTQVLYLFYGRGLGGGPGTKPPLPEVAEEIVLSHVGRLPTLDGRLQVYMQMMVTSGEQVDAESEMGARMRRLMARMSAQLDSLTQESAQGLADRGLLFDDMRMTPEKARERLEGMAGLYFGRTTMLDYLRQSTKAYDEAMRKVFSQATGHPPEAYPWPLGQPAPTLEADVWVGCEKEPCETYPRKGRVSVVVFHTPETLHRGGTREIERTLPGLLRPNALLFRPGGCAKKAIALRHLQDRFPEIDIVVVSRTLGHYHYAKEGITPEREAELLWKCFKENGLKHVVVAMAKTPGWRLPEPDGRLARLPDHNWMEYSFGGIWTDNDRKQHGSDLIVDQDGYVLNAFARHVERFTEHAFAEIIEVLLEREKAKT